MPELPEVEVLRRHLDKLVEKEVSDVHARDEMIYAEPLHPDSMSDRCAGQRLNSIDRVGKYLLMDVGNNLFLFSLRMTGQFFVTEVETEDLSNWKLILQFRAGSESLVFRSIRRFSKIHLIQTEPLEEHEKIRKLGPDPLDGLSNQRWMSCFRNRRGPIKSILMDQGFLAGLGNIYANEICFRAGVDPRRRVPELRDCEKQDLHTQMDKVLSEAISAGGSSVSDFRRASGESGGYQRYYRVYGREGEPCVNCGRSIEKIKLSGRSTYYCSQCQI